MPRRLVAVLVFVCGGFLAIAGQTPTTWYVDDDTCPEPGSGTVADPYCLIQDCIDSAMDGDECVVAPGTYFENINFLGKAITLRSTDPSDPTVVAATIIDATGLGQVSVVTCNTSEESNTILDGFTITGGTGTGGALLGGGMYNQFSSPTVINCTFSENTAGGGGGMYNNHSSPTVTNCTFSGNSADFFGGGMFNLSSSPAVTNCTFSENTAGSGGGGLRNTASSPTVTNCTFSGNTADFGGGGMSNRSNSDPTVTDCTFSGNSADFVGGGMSNAFSRSPTVTNCTFSGNSADFDGGGMYNNHSSPTVTNCTFSGNDADNGRALAFDSFNQQNPSDLSMITNCILWDGGDEVWNNDNSVIDIAYSDVQGGWPGAGNIDADPLFSDPDSGDYRLSAGSPCIDAADNTGVPEGIVTDLDGNPRFVDDPNTDDTGVGDPPIVDMGPYEFGDPCADDDGDGRVTICHIPPGNPDNAHTITVSMNAVPAHLAHGDYCGPCEGGLSADLEAGGIFGVQGEKNTRESVAPVLRKRGP